MDVQHRDYTLWAIVGGQLDADGGAVLGQVLEQVTGYERVLMVDLHGVVLMDREGLLHLLDLHRRAEGWGLRVLVVGWQPQPQQFMADIAGIRGRGSATGERYALAGFRRLIEERAHQARDLAGETAWAGPAD
ncbi:MULTISPECIES: hypothetical protein [unclassified Streptomyces]|uniref:hypothetical protein n=1 Tax=unclassified Streptomyces TaxID=2593676 RepID=UPI0029ACC815|nr:hypothetical protein [Streptomyces sp. DK15]MDX2396252.1 hypothetical protein [Streptomyces sp. DK15]